MPDERWSTAQVLALAPDTGSTRNARSVGSDAAWQAAGLFDHVLWGLCKGSGKNPYQVCVDLTGPAYKCSCPSRKFPCKHTLGLLLLWAGGARVDAPPPAWVAEWQDSRTARKAAPRAVGAGPADPAAAAKRARQRGERVGTGMADLGRWLEDQVQQGLAGAAQDGRRPFDTMAARLVDAQAPAAAGAVRRLGDVVGIGAHWADRLLGELALLRLLVAGYDRIDALPPALAATVRSRVGFPVTSEEVLAGPPVTDRWQILGQIDAEDDKLSSRRTWLRGADTGRFALLLAYAAPGQAFPADLVPGTELRADLCFYPGAMPLRALIATRHSAAAPLGAPDGAVPVREALAGWTAALATEPWRDQVPMLLADVTPSVDGHLVDAAGDGLPLAPGWREPWWLLAATGGAPGPVAGEWTPAGLQPLAAWHDGRYLPAAPPVPDGTPRSPELPGELLAAALVGTARRPWTGPAVRVGDRDLTIGASPVGATASGPAPEGASEPAGTLLTAAAVALTYRRAAATPTAGLSPVPAAPAEVLRPVPPAAAARLHRVLGGAAVPGGVQEHQDLLRVWLRAAAAFGGVAPPGPLPALLDVGRRDIGLRPVLAQVTGRRGQWLAAQRADWRYLLDEAPASAHAAEPAAADGAATTGSEAWETGSGGERLAHLLRLRRTDPAAGRELLAGTFTGESADDRARFVAALATGLSEADDGFLDGVLDDRRKPVRDAALALLRRLPGSGLGRRMTARATACVQLDRRRLGRDRLVVDPPQEADAALHRDGVPAKPPKGAGVRAWLLEEIVAATPLGTWTSGLGRPPAAILKLADGDDWQIPLVRGWARAAIAQHDGAWATALVVLAEHADVQLRTGRDRAGVLPEPLQWDLHLLLPPDELARLAAEALRQGSRRADRFLVIQHGGCWSDELGAAVLENIAHRARRERHPWELAELCRSAARGMPATQAPAARRLAHQLTGQGADAALLRPVADLAATLTFRSELHQEFL